MTSIFDKPNQVTIGGSPYYIFLCRLTKAHGEPIAPGARHINHFKIYAFLLF